MALIINKKRVSAYDLPVKESVEPTPVESKPKPKEKIDSLRDIRKKKKPEPKPVVEEKSEPELVFDPSKTYLVVNGKVKEISSKSKYLLDMLVIEE
jgi:hypothetical protein